MTATSQSGHWPLPRGARKKDSSVRKRGKTLHKRGWNGVISFFLCSPQHAAKPRCRTTGGQKAFSAVTRFTAAARDSSHVLVPLRDLHTCAALSAGQGKTALALTRPTDTKCSLQCCWHSAYGYPDLFLLKQKPEALRGRKKGQSVSWRAQLSTKDDILSSPFSITSGCRHLNRRKLRY